jgi:hypothetical protein
MHYGIPGGPRYDAAVTIWKGVWTYLAGVGVVGAADVVSVGLPTSYDELRAKWPALVVALIPALWRVLENYRKNAGRGGQPLWYWEDIPRRVFAGRLGLWLCIVAAGATFSGCLSLAPYQSGALSSNAVKVRESTATEHGVDTFQIDIRSRGDAAAKTAVRYIGETESTPWDFSVAGETSVESAARVLPLNEGAGAAMAALPQAIAPLVQAFQSAPEGPAGDSIRDVILREIIQRVLGSIAR